MNVRRDNIKVFQPRATFSDIAECGGDGIADCGGPRVPLLIEIDQDEREGMSIPNKASEVCHKDNDNDDHRQ